MSSPSQSTQTLPHPWLRRYGLLGSVIGPLVSAVGGTIAGMQWGNLSFSQAFKELGFPVAICVALAMALIWTWGVFVPKIYEEHRQGRQTLADLMNADRAAFLEALDEFRQSRAIDVTRMDRLEQKLDMHLQRNDRQARSEDVTGPQRRITPPPSAPPTPPTGR